MRFWSIMRLGLLWGGGGMLVAAGCVAWSTALFIRNSVIAKGHVTELVEYVDQDGMHMSKPRFEFTASDGQTYLVESDTATSPPSFFKGEEVDVRYVPSAPRNARIDTVVQLWLVPIILSGIGFIWCVLGVVVTAITRRKRDRLAKEEQEKLWLVEGLPRQG